MHSYYRKTNNSSLDYSNKGLLIPFLAISLLLINGLACQTSTTIVKTPPPEPTNFYTSTPTFTSTPTLTATSTPEPPTATPTVTPTPRPYAIFDDAFKATYNETCETDIQITGIEGGSFNFKGTFTLNSSGFALFCYNAKHTWIGRLTYAGYIFDSDADDPLQFMVTQNDGYVFLKGKGSVTQPDGKLVTLPNASFSSYTAPTVTEQATLAPAQLIVTHQPNPARFEKSTSGQFAYICSYKTSLTAVDVGVTIVEFGMDFWVDGQWTLSNSVFSAIDFSNWYSCPNAYIAPGQTCSDPQNWNATDKLEAAKGKWYYKGVDDNGNSVIGEAMIDCNP
jgi:hypothetical protein